MSTYKILKLEPGIEPEVKEIPGNHKAMQAEVKGHFANIQVTDSIDIWFNDDFLACGFNPTISVFGIVLYGPVFFTGYTSEGNTRSLTHEEFAQLSQMLTLTKLKGCE